MLRALTLLLACLAALAFVPPQDVSDHTPQPKEVAAGKAALVDRDRPNQNRLAERDVHVALSPVRTAALLDLGRRALLSEAWAGPLVDCPTCRDGKPVVQQCLDCFGAGEVACRSCAGPAPARLARAHSPVEVRGEFGAFLWWSWLNTYTNLERDRDGHAIGSGRLRCPRKGAPGHADGKCKLCRGKDTLACDPCRAKGVTKCLPCKGRGEIARACGDCGGFGELPQPPVLEEGEHLACLWCGGGAVRACRDCVVEAEDSKSVSSEAEAFARARVLYDAWLSGDFVDAKQSLRALPGLVDAACPTCAAGGEVLCQTCSGTGELMCADCRGTGDVASSTGTIQCPFCRGKTLVECAECLGEGEATCAACSGEEERAVPCATCAGFLWRECPGCFRGGSQHWAVNAQIEEGLMHAKEGDPAAHAQTAVANAATRVARHPSWAHERALYHAVVGLDWVTAQPLTSAELDAAIAKELAEATADLKRMRKALAALDE